MNKQTLRRMVGGGLFAAIIVVLQLIGFMIVGFVGINFLLELGVNIVLAPVISRLIRLGKKA